MKISLVLATVGRVDDVGRLVQSLIAQTSPAFELIVVDQNADDCLLPHVQAARQAGLAVNHVRLQPPNLSAARNLGIAQAQGDIVAFPDDDCWYEPQVIEAVLHGFQAPVGWSGVVAQWVEQTQAHGGQPADPALSLARWRRFRDGDASSISLFIKTSSLRLVGGFDARLGVGQWFGAGEETDLILTLLASGARLGRCPDARVHHRFAPAVQAQAAANWRPLLRRARGTGALYVKHRLPPAVVMRGLLAPLAKAVRPWRGLHAMQLALATSAGRLQGALAWLIGHKT